ncbi:MAG: hypothetical protein AB8I08_38350 [Sandaracinaceae bacterium]
MRYAASIRRMALTSLLLAFGLVGIAGCAEPGGDVIRTQANLVDKSIFEGEWWYMRTVADIHDDAAWAISAGGAGAPWPGAMASYDLASQSGVMGRIRWVIDEDFLYGYRAHEIIEGAAADADDDDYLGQPLAIFAIDNHVDVRREYSAATGEPTNVVSESADRRWYDRQYIRVDWSRNLVTFGVFGASLELDALFMTFQREPVDNFVQEGGDSRTPDSWRPQFVRIGDDPEYRFYDEWPADMADTVHYMSFVTNELWTPTRCGSATCETSIRISLRNSFLRIPPNHEYASETLPNQEYDRFGIIRTDSRTFISGGQDRAAFGRYCDARCRATCEFDEDCGTGGRCELPAGLGAGTCVAGMLEDVDDCGAGTMCDYSAGGDSGDGQCVGNLDADCGPGACNLETNMCEGGLTSYRGETDFKTFRRLRHNFYSDSLADLDDPRHTDGRCIADWQCDNRHGTADGVPGNMTSGSICDPAANRCTIPLRQRPVRAVDYRLSPGYPRHLVRSAFEVISQWNDTFMRGNRELQGEALPVGGNVSCQGTDPTQYCYCGDTVRAPEVRGDDTCAPRSDFFVAPEDRGEDNPYQCWIALVDSEGNPTAETPEINPTNPTSFEDYPAEVYNYAFVGDECMLRLNTNSCDRPVADGGEPAACEELGDIRYQFFNYATGAGAGWCGVMQQVQDPLSGEAISIPINMGGLCLDRIGTNAVNLWPVLRGEIDEDEYFTGEHIRGYYERLGDVHVPVGFAPATDGAEYDPDDPSRPAMPVDLNSHLNEMFAEMAPRFENLRSGNEGRLHIRSDRMHLLEGTAIERRLVEGMSLEGATAVASQRPIDALELENRGETRPTSSAMMEQASPFRDSFREVVTAETMREAALANNYVYYPREALFTSRYNRWWANAFTGRSVEEANIRWRQAFHRAVMLHELGHGLGLEHNFAGSYDRDNYADGYFNLVTQEEGGDRPYALPTFQDFDCGADGLCPGDAGYTAPDNGERDAILTDAESTAWGVALRAIRTRRTEAGIGNTMTSSLMDYNGDLSDMAGLGHYDRAAVFFNYFNMVETYSGDPTYSAGAGSSLDGLLRSDTTPRTLWTYYRGGESCDIDTDCPYAEGSAALSSTQGTFQRCVRNPRYSQLPTPCEGDRNCICSNFDEDMIDFVEGAYEGYNWDADRDGIPDFERIDYLFCSNSRTGDISWCNTFDAGESFQETIDHFRQVWQEGYPRNYWRNYQRGFSSGARSTRYIVDAAKMYQHLFFRFFFEPDFRRETGPLGFNDQYLASIDAMNWLAELAQLPDVGSYRLMQTAGPDSCSQTDPNDPANDESCQYAYEHMGTDMEMSGADFSLGPGQGFYTWSRYQDGLYGFFRMERAGVFWDKLIALQAMTIRDWGLSFTVDERYFINFYDLFPIEMTELFGGYVIDNDQWIAPRVRIEDGEPNVYYLNYLRGNCSNATTGEAETCRPSNQETFTDPPLMGTSNEILRLYASIFALSQFPVYYDPSFESRLAVYKLGSSDGFTIPDIQLDGEATQAYGAAIPGSGHAITTDPDEADYIIYVSDRLHQALVANKIRERLTFNLEEEQLGFQLLLGLQQQQDLVRSLSAIASPTPAEIAQLASARQRLTQGETFVESLIEVQNIFGITSSL